MRFILSFRHLSMRFYPSPQAQTRPCTHALDGLKGTSPHTRKYWTEFWPPSWKRASVARGNRPTNCGSTNCNWCTNPGLLLIISVRLVTAAHSDLPTIQHKQAMHLAGWCYRPCRERDSTYEYAERVQKIKVSGSHFIWHAKCQIHCNALC